MRNRLLLTLITVAFVSVPASATTSVTFDGTWWQGINHLEQIGAINGMMEGYDVGYYAGRRSVFKVVEGHFSQAQMTAIYNKLSPGPPSFASTTFGTIADRITDIYRDHPEVMKVPVGQFFECAATDGNCDSTVQLFKNYQPQ